VVVFVGSVGSVFMGPCYLWTKFLSFWRDVETWRS
jgi:hypothetical protein